jgi:hypothetical protein
MQLPDSIQLRRDTGLPVLPVALFLRVGLRVGLDGVGWDAYEEHFWEHRVVRFEYAYVGLPALDGAQYATGENLLGVALSALMRRPDDRRAELYAEGLKRIASSGETERLKPFPFVRMGQRPCSVVGTVQKDPFSGNTRQEEVASQPAVKVLDQTAGPHNLIGCRHGANGLNGLCRNFHLHRLFSRHGVTIHAIIA